MGKNSKKHDDENFKRWWNEQKKLKKHIEKTCSKYVSVANTNISKVLVEYIDETYNLFNCWHAKLNRRLDDTIAPNIHL